jgi:glycosyltransferase involved in cell wall biosynthesis
VSGETGPEPPPWPQIYGRYVLQCRAILEALRARPELRPDLAVANGGRGAPTLFLAEVLDCPIVTYCEYYFAQRASDLTYRLDLPPADPAPYFPRVINAPTLASLATSHAGLSPTRWQRDTFPARFRSKIDVHFDGVDERLYAPASSNQARLTSIAGRSVPPETEVVTFVARGLESLRGFDLFLATADRIARARNDVLFVVAGDDHAYYGWDIIHTGGQPFKDWALAKVGCDPSRFVFLGQVPPETLAEVLRRSDLHLYLSAPFVVSWSLFNALSTGLVVLAGDTDPVREIIEPGVTGLVAPLFDVDSLADKALGVLSRPAEYAPLGEAARRMIEHRYGIEASIPPLKQFFEKQQGAAVS